MAERAWPDPDLPRRRTSGEQAAEYIRKLVFEGYLRAGERLHQDDIATALGVSRIPVREALVALEQQGWVRLEPNRGAFVTALNERAVRDHYELAGVVYGFAAKKAIARDEGGLGEKLVHLAADFAAAGSAAEAQRIMLAYRQAILEAAASPRMNVVLRAISSLVPAEFYEAVPNARKLQASGFFAVAEAVRARDGDRTASEYARTMLIVADEVVRLFRARGLLHEEHSTRTD
jgi:DNA-binding GntR family transcriptional regulator